MPTNHFVYPSEAMDRCREPMKVEELISLTMLLNGFDPKGEDWPENYPSVRRQVLMHLLKLDRSSTVLGYLLGGGLIRGV